MECNVSEWRERPAARGRMISRDFAQVPVIAATHNCKFWLLPCCHFNLDGTKFRHNYKQARNATKRARINVLTTTAAQPGSAQARRRCGRGEPSPGADVAG